MFRVIIETKYGFHFEETYAEILLARQAVKMNREWGHTAELTADEPIPPSYDECIAAGIRDNGYQTTHGWVSSYEGEAVVTSSADGSVWKVIGHCPQGSTHFIAQRGWIEKVLMPVTATAPLKTDE